MTGGAVEGYGVYILLLATAALADWLLGLAWVGPYYRYGFPLYERRVDGVEAVPDEEALLALQGRIGAPPLAFRRLSDGSVAFRRDPTRHAFFSPAQVLHGVIRKVEGVRALEVIGHTDLWPLALLAAVALSLARFGLSLALTAVPLLLLAALYLLQFVQLQRFARVLAGTPSTPR